jgi:hypothetical protein
MTEFLTDELKGNLKSFKKSSSQYSFKLGASNS